MKIIKKIIVWILAFESRLIIWKYRPFVIAITGSVGKTSTKDAIYAVLKDKTGYVRKSEKSMNSEIGLPLTIIGVGNAWRNPREWLRNIAAGLKLLFRKNEYPDTLILELGADHPGDIKKTVKWLRPDIAVLTRVSDTPVHVEFFDSPAQVFEEKIALVRAVKKGGFAVFFADDAKSLPVQEEMSKRGVKVISYGISSAAAVRGTDFGFEYVRDAASDDSSGTLNKLLTSKFRLTVENESEIVSYRNPLGETGIYPLLAAAAVAKAKGFALSQILSGLKAYEAPRGRMNVLAGVEGSIIIDDTYNSSPDAVHAALETLRSLTCSGRKIAILGDMMELGKYSASEHRKAGREVASIANMLITVGQRSRSMAEEALSAGMSAENVRSYDSSKDVADFIFREVRANDIVLVKGSQSMRMERIVKVLLKDVREASKLLVRQDEEWLRKE